MTESFTGSASPGPRAEQSLSARGAFLVAEEAGRRARRLVDASRSIFTGNVAMFCCLPATLMIWWDVVPKDKSRILGALIMIAFAVWAVLSSLWLGRLRSLGGVKITDSLEASLNTIRKHPFRRLAPSFVFVFGVVFAWSYLFKVMPNSGVVVSMWMVAFALAAFFVGRFLRFHFWEDILFAASVAGAWSLYLLQAWRLAPLAIVPPLAVILGTVCLHQRWRAWVRFLPVSDVTPTPPKAGA
jgi:hypothetical protein